MRWERHVYSHSLARSLARAPRVRDGASHSLAVRGARLIRTTYSLLYTHSSDFPFELQVVVNTYSVLLLLFTSLTSRQQLLVSRRLYRVSFFIIKLILRKRGW